jgi:hypothetical protein
MGLKEVEKSEKKMYLRVAPNVMEAIASFATKYSTLR